MHEILLADGAPKFDCLQCRMEVKLRWICCGLSNFQSSLKSINSSSKWFFSVKVNILSKKWRSVGSTIKV